MEGVLPGCPKLWFGGVDVRDVADLHIKAMTDPAAKGERFLATSGDFVSMLEMALALKAGLGAAAAKVPSREMPNWLLRIAAMFNPEVRQLLPELGKKRNASGAKAQRLLGWSPIPVADSLVATGKSLMALGLLKSGA
jgi:dihydroflavonol-4-reductase